MSRNLSFEIDNALQIKLFNRKKIVHPKYARTNIFYKRRAGTCRLVDRLETSKILGSIADWRYLNE